MTWELRLGDCLDPVTGLASLADKSVDHVICDPPYEAEAHTKGRRGCGTGRVSTERPLDFAPMSEALRIAVAGQVVRATRRWALAFCQIDAVGAWRAAFEAAGGRWARGMVWVKPGAAPQFTGDRPGQGHEEIAAAWAGGGRMRWNGGGKHGVYTLSAPPSDGRWHPTEKPEGLMEALVKDFTDPGELICDPFAGSGTTGVAAIRLGRSFIGWERDPKYHAAAMKRLNAAREQMDMFERRVG